MSAEYMTSADDEAGARYRDKVTIVTGGSRGIGQACVEVFDPGINSGTDGLVRHGSKVVFCDLREELGAELENRLNRGLPGEAKFVKCDVTNEDDIKRLIETAVDTYGQIDCVINNAGTTQGIVTLDTLTASELRKVMEVNFIAPFQVSKFAIPHLRKTKGNIINMCSMSGVVGQGNSLAYTPSKAALIGLTKTMAVDESKHGVRVNGVSPGPTHTPLFEYAVRTAQNPEKYMDYRSKHQQFMGRLCKPEEVALACLYLATDATYSTGLNLYVSGGCELDYGLKANIEQFLV